MTDPTPDPIVLGIRFDTLESLFADPEWRATLRNAINASIARPVTAPCPHIVQDSEGTAFCDLAESGINSIGGRLRIAERERDEARAALAEATGLLREVSVANNDGEGGHESLWDAVDAYVAAQEATDA